MLVKVLHILYIINVDKCTCIAEGQLYAPRSVEYMENKDPRRSVEYNIMENKDPRTLQSDWTIQN